jgi:excisionase family DNA binding protein
MRQLSAMNDRSQMALTEHEVAHRLGLSVATLRAWRLRRKGPRFVRFGRAVRYLTSDVDGFVSASRVDNEPVFAPDGAGDREQGP